MRDVLSPCNPVFGSRCEFLDNTGFELGGKVGEAAGGDEEGGGGG